MALVQTSGLIGSIKGSIGGNTFQRSASGTIIRKKPFSAGNNTNAQAQQRAIVSRLNFLWDNLSDSDRQQWASYAVFANGANKTNRANNFSNTGKTQFFAVNSWLLIYGKNYLMRPGFAPALNIPLPCPPYYSYSNDLGHTSYDLDTTQEILVTRVSLAQGNTVRTSNTGYRTLVYSQIDGFTQDWESAYIQTFGVSLTLYKKYWISLQVVNFITGAISPISEQLVLYTDAPMPGIGSMIIGSTFIVG